MHAARLALALVSLTSLAYAGNSPVLDYLEFTTLPRNGRVSIHGSGLDQAGQVHIGGIAAMVIPIPGTNAVKMNAYIPESLPYGQWPVTVTTTAGTSNALMLDVVPSAPEGRALWRFTMNNQIMIHRPALGADGTIYAKSQAGDLIALTPDGRMKWLHQVGVDLTPEVSVGHDGTIYTADGWPTIHAINPDGTTKWTFQEPTLNQGVLAGPNVGPDGNVYVVSHEPGWGAYSLDPDGNLRWIGEPNDYSPIGQEGQEIVFSDDKLFFCQEAKFDAYDFDGDRIWRRTTVTQYDDSSPQPAVGPNGDSYVEYWGQLQSYSPDGDLNWMAFGPGGSYLRQPDVGPDGIIYAYRNVFNTLFALFPSGSVKWSYSHPETVLNPVVDPSGETLVIGGSGVGLAGPGFVLGIEADTGTVKWEHTLPIESPDPFTTLKVIPQGRARFTPDGSVAYVAAVGGSHSGGYSYLYAIQVGPIAELGHALAGATGKPRLEATGSLQPGTPVTIQLDEARPYAEGVFVMGAQAAAVPFGDGVILPSLDQIARIKTNGAGASRHVMTWPATAAPNSTLYVQAWIKDPSASNGWSASNALSLITP